MHQLQKLICNIINGIVVAKVVSDVQILGLKVNILQKSVIWQYYTKSTIQNCLSSPEKAIKFHKLTLNTPLTTVRENRKHNLNKNKIFLRSGPLSSR